MWRSIGEELPTADYPAENVAVSWRGEGERPEVKLKKPEGQSESVNEEH